MTLMLMILTIVVLYVVFSRARRRSPLGSLLGLVVVLGVASLAFDVRPVVFSLNNRLIEVRPVVFEGASLQAQEQQISTRALPPAEGSLRDEAAGEIQLDGDAVASESSDATGVTPITSVRYPNRDQSSPEWLDAEKPWTEGSMTYVVASSGVRFNSQESKAALHDRVRQEMADYVNDLLNSRHAASLLAPKLRELQPQVVQGSFEELVYFSRGEMVQTQALLGFGDPFRDAVYEQWNQVRATSRLLQAALGGGLVLLLLGVVLGYSKADTATRGYYTRRLQFAAATTILAVIATSVLFATWITWL